MRPFHRGSRGANTDGFSEKKHQVFHQKSEKRGQTISVKSNVIWLGTALANQMFTFLVDYCNLDTIFLLFCLVEKKMIWFAGAVKIHLHNVLNHSSIFIFHYLPPYLKHASSKAAGCFLSEHLLSVTQRPLSARTRIPGDPWEWSL